jgi:hypothetical protein
MIKSLPDELCAVRERQPDVFCKCLRLFLAAALLYDFAHKSKSETPWGGTNDLGAIAHRRGDDGPAHGPRPSLPSSRITSGRNRPVNKPASANLSQWHNLTGTELALITSR